MATGVHSTSYLPKKNPFRFSSGEESKGVTTSRAGFFFFNKTWLHSRSDGLKLLLAIGLKIPMQ